MFSVSVITSLGSTLDVVMLILTKFTRAYISLDPNINFPFPNNFKQTSLISRETLSDKALFFNIKKNMEILLMVFFTINFF